MGKLLHRILPLLTAIAIAAVLYDGWIFYARWQDSHRAKIARQEKQARDARRSLALIGGGGFKILNFYAASTAIHRGEHTSLCFGVTGAKSVRVNPPVEKLHPALSYCFQVAPPKDTEYTLIAENAEGKTISQNLWVKVIR